MCQDDEISCCRNINISGRLLDPHSSYLNCYIVSSPDCMQNVMIRLAWILNINSVSVACVGEGGSIWFCKRNCRYCLRFSAIVESTLEKDDRIICKLCGISTVLKLFTQWQDCSDVAPIIYRAILSLFIGF